MKLYHTRILPAFLLLGVIIGATGCTALKPASDDFAADAAKQTPASSHSASSEKIDAAAVFSNLDELSYTTLSEGAYEIAPNDLIEIDVFRVAELSKRTRVDQNGYISLQLTGVMKAAGLTQQQLEKKLEGKLSATYLQDPQVSVFVVEQTNKEVTVGGRVKRAGVFPLKSATTLSQAVALAGGLAELADSSRLVLFRPLNNGRFKAYNLDLKAIREGKMRDPYVTGKDQVIVHESGSRVWLGRVLGVTRGVVSPFRL